MRNMLHIICNMLRVLLSGGNDNVVLVVYVNL